MTMEIPGAPCLDETRWDLILPIPVFLDAWGMNTAAVEERFDELANLRRRGLRGLNVEDIRRVAG